MWARRRSRAVSVIGMAVGVNRMTLASDVSRPARAFRRVAWIRASAPRLLCSLVMKTSMKSSRAALVLAAVWALGGCSSDDLAEGGAPEEDLLVEGQVVDLTFGSGSETAMTHAVVDGIVELDWAVPAGTRSVALVRRFGAAVEGTPGALAEGEELLFSGRGFAYTDSDTVPGFIHYALFTRELGTAAYAGRADAMADLPMPSQTGELVIALAPSSKMLVAQQPANLTLSGSTSWDFERSRLTVTLGVTNGTARLLHNPRIHVTAEQGELVSDDTHGSPFGAGGPGGSDGLETGATSTRALVFEGVTGDIDPISISVELIEGPPITVGNE